LLTYHVTANRFLRGMVRTIVGTLLLVGEDKVNLKSFEEIIESKDRRSAGRAVPAQGLYLSEVQYPESIINL
jgi:tRNA pseudouridine38-40 synthase